jgi:glucose-1-phosphate thymidylyltransferase
MRGIVPAAGSGTRIQPHAFSKELLPAGSRFDDTTERPRAVSEYLVERMVRAGADKLCFVITPGTSDILEYYGAGYGDTAIAYVVQPPTGGLCDAVFRALPLIALQEPVVVGLPDTVWFPEDALCALPAGGPATGLSFLLFAVERPEYFDAVVLDGDDRVREIQVKRPEPASNWIRGAFRTTGAVLAVLAVLRAPWLERGRRDVHVGTLVNAWLARGGLARGVRAGRSYVDVGTLHGYHAAIGLLGTQAGIPEKDGPLP